ncbi:MAG: branched-chain amino acid ABC transporter substrate-binding protein [Magnetospirillum sp.]
MSKFACRMAMAMLAALPATPAAADIKIAVIEGLSGPFARSGETLLAHVAGEAELMNKNGGLNGEKIELIPFDSKHSPQEALVQLKAATDQGVRYVMQGASSGVSFALSDAITKWNARNPDKTVLFLNYTSVDPSLTNENCSFWHFRFEAHADMKLEAITNVLMTTKDAKKVYLIGQDNPAGQRVSKVTKKMLSMKRPDIQIVGDDIHAPGKVKDFAPYVSKIIASGADSVVTANFGNDLALLLKAAKDADMKARVYTFYAGSSGGPASIDFAPAGQVIHIADWHRNITADDAPLNAWIDGFNQKNRPNEFMYIRIKNMMGMLNKAMTMAKSQDPKAVALALEDMHYQGPTGDVWMRRDDHQIHMTQYVSQFVEQDGDAVKYDSEGTGKGWKTIDTIRAADSQLPTTCAMERP